MGRWDERKYGIIGSRCGFFSVVSRNSQSLTSHHTKFVTILRTGSSDSSFSFAFSFSSELIWRSCSESFHSFIESQCLVFSSTLRYEWCDRFSSSLSFSFSFSSSITVACFSWSPSSSQSDARRNGSKSNVLWSFLVIC